MAEMVLLGHMPDNLLKLSYKEADDLFARRGRVPGVKGTRMFSGNSQFGITERDEKAFGFAGQHFAARLFSMTETPADLQIKAPDLDGWLEIKTKLVGHRRSWDNSTAAGRQNWSVDDYCLASDHFAVARLLVYRPDHDVWLAGWLDAPTARTYPLRKIRGHMGQRDIPMLDLRHGRDLPVQWPWEPPRLCWQGWRDEASAG